MRCGDGFVIEVEEMEGSWVTGLKEKIDVVSKPPTGL